MKSYGRAPTFLLLTGYEQARSVAAAIAGDVAAADAVQLVLPETGVCSTRSSEFEVAGSDRLLRRACPSKRRRLLPGGRRREGCRRRWLRVLSGAARTGKNVLLRRGRLKTATTRPAIVVTGLGLTQILAWGSSYYLPAVLAAPIAAETGWPLTWIVGGLSLGLLDRGNRFAARWPHHQPARRANGVGRQLGAAGAGARRPWRRARSSRLFLRLGRQSASVWALASTMPASARSAELYGADARRMIVSLTLFGGFASTVCWPFSAFLVEHFGWRSACLVYAAIHLFVALPIHLLLIPAPPAPANASAGSDDGETGRRLVAREHLLPFAVMATAIALCSVISSMMSVHLLTVLQASGLSLAAAVSLGMLVGPSQVGARVVEMLFGRYYHPIWTMLAATLLVTIGVALLLIGFPIVLLALIPYGAGIGIESIARGTLPLALFGPSELRGADGADRDAEPDRAGARALPRCAAPGARRRPRFPVCGDGPGRAQRRTRRGAVVEREDQRSTVKPALGMTWRATDRSSK